MRVSEPLTWLGLVVTDESISLAAWRARLTRRPRVPKPTSSGAVHRAEHILHGGWGADLKRLRSYRTEERERECEDAEEERRRKIEAGKQQ